MSGNPFGEPVGNPFGEPVGEPVEESLGNPFDNFSVAISLLYMAAQSGKTQKTINIIQKKIQNYIDGFWDKPKVFTIWFSSNSKAINSQTFDRLKKTNANCIQWDTDNHHEIIDNLGADDDLFIDDEDISELISNDNNLISNNSVQMVDLEGQEFSLNLSGDDSISVEELSDSTEAVYNIEDYDRNFEEVMDEVLFASGLDSFFWDDDIDLISET